MSTWKKRFITKEDFNGGAITIVDKLGNNWSVRRIAVDDRTKTAEYEAVATKVLGGVIRTKFNTLMELNEWVGTATRKWRPASWW